MRCDDLQGLLAGLVADDLTPAQAEAVRLHLAQCPDCQELYTGLVQTRRQLALLATDYHPNLAPRITRVIEGHRTRQSVLNLVGRALQSMGALAAIALVVTFLIWQQGPKLPTGPGPSATGPHKVYLFQGNDWTEIDLGRGRSRSVTMPNGQLLPGGFLLQDGLYTLDPSSPLQPLRIPLQPEASGEEAAASLLRDLPLGGIQLHRSGGIAWAVRTEWPEVSRSEPAIPRFAVDRIDLTTGEIDRNEEWKAGLVNLSTLSPNGSYLYLVADLEGDQYVKAVDTRTRHLVAAYQLPRPFTPQGRALASPDERYLHLLEPGRWLTLDLATGRFSRDLQYGQITTVAALSPEGDQLLIARPEGGLALWAVHGAGAPAGVAPRAASEAAAESRVDAAGEVGASGPTFPVRGGNRPMPLKQTDGRQYQSLDWKGGWIYATHDGGIDLIRAEGLQVDASYPLSQPGPIYLP